MTPVFISLSVSILPYRKDCANVDTAEGLFSFRSLLYVRQARDSDTSPRCRKMYHYFSMACHLCLFYIIDDMQKAKRNICLVEQILKRTYKSPRLGNKRNPLNELLFIQLSLRTTGPSFERVYSQFKKRFPKWNDVYSAPQKEVASALFNAGLSNQKAASLKAILSKLKADFKRVSLTPIRKYSDRAMEDYLCSLPGIGKKSARCIMLYSFDRKVFPVDAHCFRIIKRLGWIRQDAKYTDRMADMIQQMMPSKFRYPMHVNMVAHGRALCLDRYPKCKICPLLKACPFGQKKIVLN